MRPDLMKAYEILRSELIAARKRAGVPQRDVAAVLGAHQQFWSKVESGERRVDVVELTAVAELLQLDVAALVATLQHHVTRSRNKTPRKSSRS